ncbi:MAG: prolipoprotein diacylglyceryl transferase [Anaerolineae bacterium]|nr:prolipoprotein diacylglyceryl transferase [Anaerolineae bacterium]
MNPVVFEAGPIVVRAYTAWLGGGILLALGVIAWRAYRADPRAVAPWLDVGIAALIGGVIGARLLYVALEWDFFADSPDQMVKIWLGGLAWHGTLLAGLPAALVMARVRRVPLKPWTDAAALAWPVGLIAAWIACRRAGCGYGAEVRTLADWPGWLVEELPDVYGLVAPRLEVQLAGALWGAVLLALALILTWRGWLAGLRLWIVLALTGLGLAVIGFFRADPAHTLIHRRADQVFDLGLLFASTLTGGMIWLLDRRAVRLAAPDVEDKPDEHHAGTGPDPSEAG